MCSPEQIKKYGAQPANIQWSVVRGDTAIIKVEFFESNETTEWDTTGWTYKSTAYDPQGNELDELAVTPGDGYVIITADASITQTWGTGYKSVVAELPFDLQVTLPGEDTTSGTEDDIIWTPIIGTICVFGDVTPGEL